MCVKFKFIPDNELRLKIIHRRSSRLKIGLKRNSFQNRQIMIIGQNDILKPGKKGVTYIQGFVKCKNVSISILCSNNLIPFIY